VNKVRFFHEDGPNVVLFNKKVNDYHNTDFGGGGGVEEGYQFLTQQLIPPF
jgi:hypothetical protein